MFCDSGRVRQWLLSSAIGLLEFALGVELLGAEFFAMYGVGKRRILGNVPINFVKFCKEAEDIRTFENAQKNRKSIEPFSS
jgi:hypothetical protein